MAKQSVLLALSLSALGALAAATASAADNCTGYDVLVTTYAETKDLGGGMMQSTFSSDSVITSDNSIYHLTTGQCTGTSLSTPDGKVSVSGFCARRDKDGDTQSIEWSLAPGADKGMWKSNGGTGKFAGKKHAGWFQNVRADGKMAVSKWGGTCN